MYELYNLTNNSLLIMTLQVGLSALKTPACYQEENQNFNCPVCTKESFGKLAQGLPQAHHMNSCLVCKVTGELMNEDNPPMALPNGNVYSRKAIEQILNQNGKIEDPRSGAVFSLAQCRKVYIS